MKKTKKSITSDSAIPEPAVPTPEKASFPIIGIGASAGGLEAFELFFKTMPAESGMAFVLVPHLDPGHASMLSEILQRNTTMPVHEAQDQIQIQPNHVYIIPPGKDMAIFHGVLNLSIPELARGLRLPIDSFFRSLAEDQGERAICVILSGSGSDGTRVNVRFASSSPAAGRTARSGSGQSTEPAGLSLCRNHPPQNMTACRQVLS